MTDHQFNGMDGTDPLGFLAALGLLRVLSESSPDARIAWKQEGGWVPVFSDIDGVDPVEAVLADVERWRSGHPALAFAVGADRKVQDLKHPPEKFRELMRSVRDVPEAAAFVTAYATGVALDGSGQTKPTSLHFTAGQQRFLDAVLSVLEVVGREDIEEALDGPWVGRTDARDTRWRAGSERNRALLSYDPSKESTVVVAGAVWLAFQSLPLFPAVPVGSRIRTTGFEGRGHRERFVWPLWSPALNLREVAVTTGLAGLSALSEPERRRRGIAGVMSSKVNRSSQGYGNFAAAVPL